VGLLDVDLRDLLTLSLIGELEERPKRASKHSKLLEMRSLDPAHRPLSPSVRNSCEVTDDS